MNLRLLLLGVEVLRITTDTDDPEADEYDGSGYTGGTVVGFTQDNAPGWHVPLHEPEWGE